MRDLMATVPMISRPASIIQLLMTHADRCGVPTSMAVNGPHRRMLVRPRELAAYCRELAAMTRAGMALPLGADANAFLSRMEMPAETNSPSESGGRLLVDRLRAEMAAWPPPARAIVETGIASGRLAESLETVARWADPEGQIRRQLSTAWVYPAILLMSAFGLFGVVAGRLAAEIEAASETAGGTLPAWWPWYSPLARTAWFWCQIPPVLILVAALLRWTFRNPNSLPWVFSVFPGFSDVRHALCWGRWCDLMGLMTGSGVPLPQALQLAGGSTGDAKVIAACESAATAVIQGQKLSVAMQATTVFPSGVQNVVRSTEQHGGLSPALIQFGDILLHRATQKLERARRLLPFFITVVIGGTIVVCYAAAVFLPVIHFLKGLFREALSPNL